jgi:hypothetical protein
MYRAHKVTCGVYISGEIKVALALRIFAGGSVSDMDFIFGFHYNYANAILNDVLDWIINCNALAINIVGYLGDDDRLRTTAQAFAEKSGGVLGGCIGALDGWLVKIKCPSLYFDGVRNPGSYYCRKGYYALNCQAIVDKNKRIIWASIGNVGCTHDSACFKKTALYTMLTEMAEELLNKGYYFIGDSAYALRSWLLVPFDSASPGSREDVFNYLQSADRIFVECAFGEVDRRWGIFWKRLEDTRLMYYLTRMS